MSDITTLHIPQISKFKHISVKIRKNSKWASYYIPTPSKCLPYSAADSGQEKSAHSINHVHLSKKSHCWTHYASHPWTTTVHNYKGSKRHRLTRKTYCRLCAPACCDVHSDSDLSWLQMQTTQNKSFLSSKLFGLLKCDPHLKHQLEVI